MRKIFSPPVFLKDYGGEPIVLNLKSAALQNNNYRKALWTGQNMQITLMSIPVGSDIGFERHDNLDQLIRVEKGTAEIIFARTQNSPMQRFFVREDYVFVIPAGVRHNVKNIGRSPLKLSSVYAPPNHPFGVEEKTKM